jgi:prevent-host-death family protein
MMKRRLGTVTVRELNRNPAGVLARVNKGERLIVCRNGRPVATLQPLDGTVLTTTGSYTDVHGAPLGDTTAQLERLSDVQRYLLANCIRRWRLFPWVGNASSFGSVSEAVDDLQLLGYLRKTHLGLEITGRGLVLHEALVTAAGLTEPSEWLLRRRADRQ